MQLNVRKTGRVPRKEDTLPLFVPAASRFYVQQIGRNTARKGLESLY